MNLVQMKCLWLYFFFLLPLCVLSSGLLVSPEPLTPSPCSEVFPFVCVAGWFFSGGLYAADQIHPAGELDLSVQVSTELMHSGIQHIPTAKNSHLSCFPMECDGPTTVAQLFSV